MFTGLVEAPVCVYCDTLLYLDDRLVSTGREWRDPVSWPWRWLIKCGPKWRKRCAL